MTPSISQGDRTAAQVKKGEPRALSGLLQFAVNLVFGVPTVWGALVLIRGRHLWSSHRLFGDALGAGPAYLSLLVAALGMLWMGVTLLLSGGGLKRAAGTSLLAVGAALIFGLRP